jgi:hypothetical protein
MAKAKVRKIVWSDIEKMDTQEVIDMFPEGSSFVYLDWDKWYVVKYIYDNIPVGKKKQEIPLVVIKSWSKYKQRWTYKTEHLAAFVYTACLFTLEAEERKKDKKKDAKKS